MLKMRLNQRRKTCEPRWATLVGLSAELHKHYCTSSKKTWTDDGSWPRIVMVMAMVVAIEILILAALSYEI